MCEAVWVPGSHTQSSWEVGPRHWTGWSTIEKPEGKYWHAGEPEASVPWEQLRVTQLCSLSAAQVARKVIMVWCGLESGFGFPGESLQCTPVTPESQGYQPTGSQGSCPAVHPTLLLMTTSQHRKQGEGQASAHVSLYQEPPGALKSEGSKWLGLEGVKSASSQGKRRSYKERQGWEAGREKSEHTQASHKFWKTFVKDINHGGRGGNTGGVGNTFWPGLCTLTRNTLISSKH